MRRRRPRTRAAPVGARSPESKGSRSRPAYGGCGGLATIAWLLNPYAAGVLVVATHLWLFAAGGWRGVWALLAIVLGLVPIVLIAVYYGFALDLGPVGLAWGSALGAISGSGLWTTLLLGGLLAGLAGVIRVLIARRRLGPAGGPGAPIRTRGPVSYAGPGSLGGTESALRR